jgi:hypothetical protein
MLFDIVQPISVDILGVPIPAVDQPVRQDHYRDQCLNAIGGQSKSWFLPPPANAFIQGFPGCISNNDCM